MAYNVKNYTEQGGEVTHIGGKLIFDEGAQVEGFPGTSGGSQLENQAESEATTVAALKADFNSLLTKLKAAGLMAADATEETPEPVTPDTPEDPETPGETDGTEGE